MTANAEPQMDPLARLGRQIVAAAEHRVHRRHRRRTLLTVSAATLAVGGAVGVAAIQTDIVGPTPPQALPHFTQYGTDRIDLQVSEGLDKPWKVAVYRTIDAGLCITAPTSGARTSRVQCGAAFITADELDRAPVTSTVGTIVQHGADGDAVLVSGLARLDVERLELPSQNGATAETPIDGATLEIPVKRSANDTSQATVTVRPFAVLVTVPTGSTHLRLVARTHDGAASARDVHVDPAAVTP